MSALMGSIEAASALAEKLRDRGLDCNSSKVQKLLYITYAALLGEEGKRLCAEFPRAWTSGPVFANVFDWTHGHGDKPAEHMHGEVPALASLFMDAIISSFGDWPASKLASVLSAPGTPCARTLDGDGDPPLMTPGTKGSFIPDEWTKRWAQERILKTQEQDSEGNTPACAG